MASYQYVYHMHGMSKAYPGGKKILDNVHLSFYPTAKIGVLGPNGSGKSTLLKIMAGIDKDFQGEAWPGENVTVGYLPQEPHLDPSKTVLLTFVIPAFIVLAIGMVLGLYLGYNSDQRREHDLCIARSERNQAINSAFQNVFDIFPQDNAEVQRARRVVNEVVPILSADDC